MGGFAYDMASTAEKPASGGSLLQFATFASEIELPFYSALFDSKLDYDKLDESARNVLGLYEHRVEVPQASCNMQILGNALTSQR